MSGDILMTWYAPKHFKRSEFSCKCGCGLGGRNDDFMNAALLIGIDMIRSRIGSAVRVNSGWRCETHNSNVGGHVRSRHMFGCAVDISTENYQTLCRIVLDVAPLLRLKIKMYDKERFVHVQA